MNRLRSDGTDNENEISYSVEVGLLLDTPQDVNRYESSSAYRYYSLVILVSSYFPETP